MPVSRQLSILECIQTRGSVRGQRKIGGWSLAGSAIRCLRVQRDTWKRVRRPLLSCVVINSPDANIKLEMAATYLITPILFPWRWG